MSSDIRNKVKEALKWIQEPENEFLFYTWEENGFEIGIRKCWRNETDMPSYWLSEPLMINYIMVKKRIPEKRQVAIAHHYIPKWVDVEIYIDSIGSMMAHIESSMNYNLSIQKDNE